VGKVFACREMMILVEGELKSCGVLTLKEGLRIGGSGKFFVLFFSFFYDSFINRFLEYLVGCVMSWVSA